MGGYIGATAVGLTTTAADVQGDITSTDTTPELILKNTSEEDTEGGREGKITFKGEQSGGEESTLAQIESAHDGTSDDQKGDLIFKTNDGSDGASPTEAMRITSQQRLGIGTNDPTELLTVRGAAHFGKTAIATSADTPVIIKSDTDHLALHLEENSGAESWQIGVDADGDLGFHNSGAADATVTFDDSGNVGIGTTSPATKLDVDGGANSDHATFSGTAGRGLKISTASGGAADEIVDFDAQSSGSTQALTFSTGGTERVRIDGSGNVLVGKTAQNHTDVGHTLYPAGGISVVRSGGQCAVLNRTTSNGTIIDFRKDSTNVGSIGYSGNFVVHGTHAGLAFRTSDIVPTDGSGNNSDNTEDLGDGAVRFDDVFATNGTIQTSDETEKQDIASLTSAEITAATAISKLFKTFKWKDKVAAKGDNARTHTGVVAQQVQSAMSDAGLDASKYAFWCSDTWTNDDGNEQTRMGIRYPELLAFIGAATEQRLTSIEARLDALEAE